MGGAERAGKAGVTALRRDKQEEIKDVSDEPGVKHSGTLDTQEAAREQPKVCASGDGSDFGGVCGSNRISHWGSAQTWWMCSGHLAGRRGCADSSSSKCGISFK